MIAFWLPGHPETFALNLGGRRNQYDLWPPFRAQARQGDDLVLALDASDRPPDTIVRLTPYFAGVQPDSLVSLRNRHGIVATRRLWVLTGWGGEWPASGERR